MSSAQADEDQLWRQFHGRWEDWKQLIVQVPLPALLVLFITLWWSVARYQAPKKPPGPWPWPILGNLPTISSSKKLPHQILRDLAAKYGGFMYLRMGMQVITTVCVYIYHHNLWPYMCRLWGWQLCAFHVVRRFESLEMLLMIRWVVVSWNLRRNMLVIKRELRGIHWCHFEAESGKEYTFKCRWSSNKLQGIFPKARVTMQKSIWHYSFDRSDWWANIYTYICMACGSYVVTLLNWTDLLNGAWS